LADDASKWKPQTRETADHSLPFLVAVALLTQNFWFDSYNLIHDKKILELASKVEVNEVEEYTKMYPSSLPVKITIKYFDNTQESAYREVPKGHYKKPMNREEIITKAKRLGLDDRVINYISNIENKEAVTVVF
jgi:Uncharacterized protein involved in propionate catabolism